MMRILAATTAALAASIALSGCSSDESASSPSTTTARSSTMSASASTSATTTAPPPTTAAPPPPAAAPTTTRAATFSPSDPRCGPAADNIVGTVAAGLNRSDYRLTNGTVLANGPYVYFGATIVDAAGTMKSRSDVWVLRDGIPYASTGGARNNSTFPKASTVLKVGPGDPPVAAVDNCVVNATLGR